MTLVNSARQGERLGDRITVYDAKLKIENGIPKEIIVLRDAEQSIDVLKDLKENADIPVEIRKEEREKSKPKKNKPVYKNIVYNRKWQILENVSKNQPTTSSSIANQLGVEQRTIDPTLRKLADNQWLRREKNTMFDNKRIKYVYYIGSQSVDFLENYSGFLYPDNPYDPLEDGSRREKVIKKKAQKISE